MRLSPLKILFISIFCLSVVGCQHSAPVKPASGRQAVNTPVNEQINQLASLIAAGNYLKLQCNRSDLPDNNTMQKTALQLAKQKGWDTSHYQALPQLSANLYQGLLKDGTLKATQCSAFNRSLEPFIEAMRSNK
ncbi:type II secretion system pilot lipoprotein GspS [Pectobacteriaceae bacterium CE70]|nr:type II secretion system pilot lipoprotein GspS [Pectobacteriaceae bacterium C52]WJV65665.1 type II secretion system pilot lipoprotein GspS [Pectobacteriaceae bacterium CE70]WJY09687.1 type II secretion system pilot lipoprotein GspS [Pectobacteriaceae bacterium C80]